MGRLAVNLASQHERVRRSRLARTLIVLTTLCGGHHLDEIEKFNRQSIQNSCLLAITEITLPANASLTDGVLVETVH